MKRIVIIEGNALSLHRFGERLAAEERAVYEACAADTRAIIARINDCKETP